MKRTVNGIVTKMKKEIEWNLEQLVIWKKQYNEIGSQESFEKWSFYLDQTSSIINVANTVDIITFDEWAIYFERIHPRTSRKVVNDNV